MLQLHEIFIPVAGNFNRTVTQPVAVSDNLNPVNSFMHLNAKFDYVLKNESPIFSTSRREPLGKL